jgi:hypothetical protein
VHPPGYGISTVQAMKLNTHCWHVLAIADKAYEETYEAVTAASLVTPTAIKKLLRKAQGGRQIKWAKGQEGMLLKVQNGFCFVTPGAKHTARGRVQADSSTVK